MEISLPFELTLSPFDVKIDLGENMNEKIKELRLKNGASKAQIAKALEISPYEYQKIENGEQKPTNAQLKKVAFIYNIDLQALTNVDADNIAQEVSKENKAQQIDNKSAQTETEPMKTSKPATEMTAGRKTLTIFNMILSAVGCILFMLPLIEVEGVKFGYIDFLNDGTQAMYKVCAIIMLVVLLYTFIHNALQVISYDIATSKYVQTGSAVCMIANCISSVYLLIVLYEIHTPFTIVYSLLQSAICVLSILSYVVVGKDDKHKTNPTYHSSKVLNIAIYCFTIAIAVFAVLPVCEVMTGDTVAFVKLFDYVAYDYQKIALALMLITVVYSFVHALLVIVSNKLASWKYSKIGWEINFMVGLVGTVLMFVFAGFYTADYGNSISIWYVWAMACAYLVLTTLAILTYIKTVKIEDYNKRV